MMALAQVRGRRGRRGSDVVDRHIGARLRERRRALGLSQAQLAARMGFTPPQINRYEHGTTRLSGSGLWRAAQALEATALQVSRLLHRLSPTVRDRLISFIASLARD